ncbi:MAG: prenyltransferase/squalene oxidase repeat-containing protein [Chloroflexota bacterium]|nr:prenyltransferase/squalene oxidase repeat-containing protein [Chloroflexota bacterium]
MPTIRKVQALIVLLLLCTLAMPAITATPSVSAYSPYPLQPTDTQVSNALDYLRSVQETDGCISDFDTSAWVTLAIAAAGEDPHDWIAGDASIVDYLATNAGSASSLTDYERMVLAIVAAGEDPTSFGSIDFVALIEAAYDGTQIGDNQLLNDDFWGLTALIAAGKNQSTEIIVNTVDFIKANQNTDGGWSWGVGESSDVDDTAAAIMALLAAGESQGTTTIQNALSYIKSTQMDCGGFESWGETNSATNSWGVSAIAAAGEDPTSTGWQSGTGHDPVDDLLTFQNPDGSFNWTAAVPSNVALMTAYAIPALVGEPHPVKVLDSVYVRIEGQNSTIWSGSVVVTDSTITDDEGIEHYLPDPTAIGALDEASQAGGFPYVAQDTAYGLYVFSVNGEEPEGANGWMYRVNYHSPMVGCADFVLGETTPPDPPHTDVLFYWGAWDDVPLSIALDKTEVAVAEEFTATVTYYNNVTETWVPLEGATVHIDQDYTTGVDGTVTVSVDHDATLEICAEKDAHVRSDTITVVVGNGQDIPDDGDVSLRATIIPAISIEVEPSEIDFGVLGPRDISDPHTITITNSGAWEVLVTAEVTDDATSLFIEGLNLDGNIWNVFSTTIARDTFQTTEVTLAVPEDYAGVGTMAGTIIFWAAES